MLACELGVGDFRLAYEVELLSRELLLRCVSFVDLME